MEHYDATEGVALLRADVRETNPDIDAALNAALAEIDCTMVLVAIHLARPRPLPTRPLDCTAQCCRPFGQWDSLGDLRSRVLHDLEAGPAPETISREDLAQLLASRDARVRLFALRAMGHIPDGPDAKP